MIFVIARINYPIWDLYKLEFIDVDFDNDLLFEIEVSRDNKEDTINLMGRIKEAFINIINKEYETIYEEVGVMDECYFYNWLYDRGNILAQFDDGICLICNNKYWILHDNDSSRIYKDFLDGKIDLKQFRKYGFDRQRYIVESEAKYLKRLFVT